MLLSLLCAVAFAAVDPCGAKNATPEAAAAAQLAAQVVEARTHLAE